MDGDGVLPVLIVLFASRLFSFRINNCVGENNQKFFVLFTVSYCPFLGKDSMQCFCVPEVPLLGSKKASCAILCSVRD